MKFKYLLAYSIPLSVMISFTGGPFSFFGIFYAFVIIPGLEYFIPLKQVNNMEQDSSNDLFFDVLIWSMVPIQYLLLCYYCYLLGSNSYLWHEYVGMTLSMGIACGTIGINVAHELGHRKTKHEKLMALSLLLTSQYMHFYIDHNRVHHKLVSTPLDPTTARMGESLYAFFYRSIIGNWKSSFKIAPKETLFYLFLQIFFIIFIGYFFGRVSAAGAMFAAFFGILLLETVNYIEHYGLMRKQNPETGRFEKVQAKHSWNSNHSLGRVVLFELSRHSDHHANAHTKYQNLRSIDSAPQMPAGYPAMMLISLIPAIWFKVMNPLVKKSANL